MKLYDEEEVRLRAEKNRKMRKYVLIGITFTVVLIAVLMIVIYLLIQNPNKITVYVNRNEDKKLENIFITEISQTDDSKILYAPIRELAGFSNYWTYKSYDGEGAYGAIYEIKDSCHIISDKEVVLFYANSNIIYRIDLEQQKILGSDYKYEEIKIKNPVISKNNKLYVDLEGIEKAFNTTIIYQEKAKRVQITTLNTHITGATSVATKAGYKEIDEAFVNQRAILDNRIVVTSENKSKGIIVYTDEQNGNKSGKEIRGAQYKEITYIPQKKLFIVKGINDKVGIVTADGEQKIDLDYDDLLLIDDEKDLYLAKNGDYYGVIDINQNVIIYLEYSKIGVDISEFKKNGLKNGYVLLDKLIPVEQNGKWGFYAIEKDKNTGAITSKRITNIEYETIGCKTTINKGVVGNIMVMSDYGLVVVKNYGRYGLMDTEGILPLNLVLTDLYMETVSGQNKYIMVDRYNNTHDMIEYLDGLVAKGVIKKQ